ncbi:unnamed protein product [Fraxinus pennsylvanica]|uniref:Uncharacterized protein n=1 Tax=Fraxinus pennsylvanica TaxID=56036 RepID=A0AAD1ZKS1_9LAMI|nr:unnamed protein product [Fraxinus pennsylvanica]
MPMATKEELLSDDVQKPARFSRVQVGCHENGMLSRDFLNLYAHPLHHFLNLWPSNPLKYREKMGMYATEVRKLGIELFGAIMESLNLSPTHLKTKFRARRTTYRHKFLSSMLGIERKSRHICAHRSQHYHPSSSKFPGPPYHGQVGSRNHLAMHWILGQESEDGDRDVQIVLNDSGVRLVEDTVEIKLADFLVLEEKKEAQGEVVFWDDVLGHNIQLSLLFYVQVKI